MATVLLLPAGPLAADRSPDPPTVSEKGLHLVLNVPGRKLHVYENGTRTRTFSVSVGLPGFETPQGEYQVSEVIWNPWWHPPESDWARDRKPTPPGAADNPMGKVKLLFGPLLYIHGTPEGEPMGRLSSRGCVRMRNEDVIELAMLVHKHAVPGTEPRQLEKFVASPTLSRAFPLRPQVRFTAHYTIAAVENGFLIIYPDVYGLAQSEMLANVERVLAAQGIDPAAVNKPRLRALVRKSGTTRLAIAVDSLLAPPPRVRLLGTPIPLGVPVPDGGR
ncbi:MAG TPA: L,D-transpeptidase [Longimicrobiales bacterium]|nr:L,D-transpeptidase [Longimicrobiales bacterium]